MALNFPNAPIDGQKYPSPALPGVGQWQWNQLLGLWQATPFYVRLQDGAYNDYLWPTTAGENGQVLTTSGTGELSWGGAVTEVTFFQPLALLESFDGVNRAFTFVTPGTLNPYTPTPSSNVVVFLGGVPQVPGSSYDVSANTITFTEAPLPGATFTAFTTASLDPDIPVASYLNLLGFAESFDGVRTTFTLEELGTSNPFSPNPSSNLAVFLGGVPQVPVAAYSVSGNQVTFTEPPLAGSSSYAISMVPSFGITPNYVIKLLSVLGNFSGEQTSFNLVELGTTEPFTPGPSENIMVFLGGVTQEYGSAFFVDGDVITFSEAPEPGTTFYAITCFSLL